ncbi:hypothetical protein J3D55_003021 [Chryseobacterium ginsenosidimutans]|uniref:DUF1883 domain-containing protein n=1 Tax=Chryseobacterium ginsenosidimutans TaxID=687846 RepID=UPI002169BF4D|nr:DUF1883 domain-containing protein [Chryseobacterium ginsenosidimutans]MCS3870105.1 hypothetical protein [Chryseobacterium ginsenosidimutans]
MNYQSYNLGNLEGGEIVEVILRGNSANVKLLDNANFGNYKSGRKYNYYGGHVTKSPFKIKVPHYGSWYVVIDLGGYSGSINSSVRVIS